MSIKESELNAIGSIQTNDYLRAVTHENSSCRALVSTVAQTIIENYSGSSLGGVNRSLKEAIDAMLDYGNLVDYFYPIGSYYETSDDTFNPNVSWRGTWEKESEGLVHIGSGTNYPIGTTGGESTHKLLETEMPSHTHTSSAEGYGIAYINGVSGTSYAVWSRTGNHATGAKGGSQPHNNMQPYVVINRWHRVR